LTDALNFVVAVIVNDRDELLLLLRSPNAKRDPAKWGLSGGRLEAGETVQEGMHRELNEELGMDLKLRLVSQLGPLPAIGIKAGTVHLFHFIWVSGVIHLNPEHTAYQWVNRYTLNSLELMPGVQDDLTFFGIWSSI
jgi:8-oxo-dGTP diphosphatase